MKLGFSRLVCVHSAWVYLRDGVRIIIPVFIDDITIAAMSNDTIQHVKDDLCTHFKLRDLGPTSWLLGVKHPLSILSILKHYGFSDCNPVGMPMDPGLCVSAEMGPKTSSEA